jgi:hypothetical protein
MPNAWLAWPIAHKLVMDSDWKQPLAADQWMSMCMRRGHVYRATKPCTQPPASNTDQGGSMKNPHAIRQSHLLVAAALSIALGACAQHEARPVHTSTSTTSSTRTAHTAKIKSTPAKAIPAPKPVAAPDTNLIDAPTGIADCDDYLAHFKACHAVLGTKFNDIDAQLTIARATVLDTARDKGMDAAKDKCAVLVKQRDAALMGRTCK